MTRQILILLLITLNFAVYGQTFEGWITYKLEVLNPNPEMIPDSSWQEGIKEQFGPRGYMLQKYYYKQANYFSEIDAGKEKGFQAYNPSDGLLYSWQENSDTALTINSKRSADEYLEIIEADKTDTILGIACNSILVNSKMGQMTLWYNRDHFKMDPSLYEGHVYGHWEQILKKIECLPLKMEQKGFMSHVVQIAVEYKATAIDEEQFEIPKFKEVVESPVN